MFILEAVVTVLWAIAGPVACVAPVVYAIWKTA